MKPMLWLIILLLVVSNVITFTLMFATHKLYECQRTENKGYWLNVYIVTYTPVNYTVYQDKELVGYTKMQPIYGLKRGSQMQIDEYKERCE